MIAASLANVVAYSLHVTALVGTAVVMTRVLPIFDPRWRQRVYQALFAAAVILPLLQQWLTDLALETTASRLSLIIRSDGLATIGTQAPWLEVAAFVLAAGVCVRVGHLLLGWVAIQRYVNRSTPLDHIASDLALAAGDMPYADVRLSGDVRSPATVGIWRAVILVPPRFLTLSTAAQRAVLLHEFLHVRRLDWLRMVVEELWCALLWFHPLAHLLVSRLDLAREMLVDRCVLDATHDRRAYAQALLAFAGDDLSSARAVLPLIRPDHLSDRIAAVAEEGAMSRHATFAAVLVACLTVSATTAASVRLLPMGAPATPPAQLGAPSAQAEDVVLPGEGVTLPKPTYEQKPEYTAAAMQAKIEGTVLLAIVVQTDGMVGRVRVTKSLDTMHGLDEAAMAAARQWRFEPGRKDGKPVPVEVTLEFRFTLRN